MSKRALAVISTLSIMITIIMFIGLRQPTSTALANGGGTFTTHLPIITNNAAPVPYPGFFGIQVYGATTPATQFHNELLESGAQTIRNFVPWQTVEPVDTDPANFDWSDPDGRLYVARSDKSDLEIILTLEGNPDWAAPGIHRPLFDDAYDDFSEFVTALVERYDGDGIDDAPGSPVMKYLELYNEPDNRSSTTSNSGSWGSDPDKYALMLSKAYAAAKAANPNIKIAFGGIAYDFNSQPDDPFVKDFFPDVLDHLRDGNYSCGYCFDAMNVHGYPAFNGNWTTKQGPGLYEKIEAVRDVLAGHGLRDMEMIITETGWHSNTTPNVGFSDEEIQARYVTELMVESRAANVSMMTWWMLYDLPDYPFDNGLVSLTNQKKKAFTAFQYSIEALRMTEPDGILSDSETGNELMAVYKFSYAHTDNELYVAWMNPVESTVSETLVIDGSAASITNIYGDSVRAVVMDEDDGVRDGRVSIQVTAQPVYLEVSK